MVVSLAEAAQRVLESEADEIVELLARHRRPGESAGSLRDQAGRRCTEAGKKCLHPVGVRGHDPTGYLARGWHYFTLEILSRKIRGYYGPTGKIGFQLR